MITGGHAGSAQTQRGKAWAKRGRVSKGATKREKTEEKPDLSRGPPTKILVLQPGPRHSKNSGDRENRVLNQKKKGGRGRPERAIFPSEDQARKVDACDGDYEKKKKIGKVKRGTDRVGKEKKSSGTLGLGNGIHVLKGPEYPRIGIGTTQKRKGWTKEREGGEKCKSGLGPNLGNRGSVATTSAGLGVGFTKKKGGGEK